MNGREFSALVGLLLLAVIVYEPGDWSVHSAGPDPIVMSFLLFGSGLVLQVGATIASFASREATSRERILICVFALVSLGMVGHLMGLF